MMKREREEDHHHSITMANYLMIFSCGSDDEFTTNNFNRTTVFECKTCNRQFPSFQALGGHRASHKKLKLIGDHSTTSDEDRRIRVHGSRITKPKTHECSICGMEFAIGQALGGHMRRHKTTATRGEALNNKVNMHNFINSINTITTTESGSSRSSTVDNNTSANRDTKKSVLFLDLNLTPIENDLEILKIGQPTPNLVDCFN